MTKLVYLAFAAASLIWGSTFLAIRIGNESVPPLWALTLRLLLAAPALAALAWLTHAPFPRGAALRGATLFGIFNLGVNLPLLYWAELVVPSGIAAVFYATVPLSTALLASGLGVERLSARKVTAAVAAFVGVAVIFAGELSLDVPPIGLLAILAAATSASLSQVFLKRAPQQSTFTANAIGSVVAIPLCLLASVLAGEQRALPTSAAGWLPILYLVLAGSLGAFVIYFWLVAHWAVTKASFVGVVVPVIAVILGALVRAERPAALTFVGAAIVLGAVAYAISAPARPVPQVREAPSPAD